jgi:hypothetical protein
MAFNSSSSTDRYELVSSLYGPGTVIGWYLILISCFVSWTVHPKKRVSDTINSDFIAVLTMPTVAAGHLVFQRWANSSSWEEMRTTENPELLKLLAALAAPFIIVETFVFLWPVLLFPAIIYRCQKRSFFVAAVGITNVFANGIVSNGFVLCLFIGTLMVGSKFCFSNYKAVNLQDTRSELEGASGSPRMALKYEVQDQIFGTYLFLLMLALMCFICLSLGVNIYVSTWGWPVGAAGRFPQTNQSMKELDQAVAALAGATVLVLSIYTALVAQYRQRRSKSHMQPLPDFPNCISSISLPNKERDQAVVACGEEIGMV